MTQTKEQIRQLALEKRNSLPETERQQKSQAILEKLQSIPKVQEASKILVYFPIDNEVDVSPLIDSWLPNKNLSLPRIDGDSFEAVLIKYKSDLTEGKFGIPEPTGSEVIDPEKLDLVIVPGVAFDATGARIGRGKGYYDRFLKKCTNAYKVGVAFDIQLLDAIPNEPYDVNVDSLITESQIFNF